MCVFSFFPGIFQCFSLSPLSLSPHQVCMYAAVADLVSLRPYIYMASWCVCVCVYIYGRVWLDRSCWNLANNPRFFCLSVCRGFYIFPNSLFSQKRKNLFSKHFGQKCRVCVDVSCSYIFKFVTLKTLILFVFRNFAVLLHDREQRQKTRHTNGTRRVKRNQITQARAHDVNKIFWKISLMKWIFNFFLLNGRRRIFRLLVETKRVFPKKMGVFLSLLFGEIVGFTFKFPTDINLLVLIRPISVPLQ